MSNLMKKVRIIHSPVEMCYYVEEKPVLGFRWKRVAPFKYVEKRDTSPLGCHDLASDAFAKAKAKAELLLARTVVWEQTNYFWGG